MRPELEDLQKSIQSVIPIIKDFLKGSVIIFSALIKSLVKVRDGISQAFSGKTFAKIIGYFITILDKMKRLPLVGKTIARLLTAPHWTQCGSWPTTTLRRRRY